MLEFINNDDNDDNEKPDIIIDDINIKKSNML